MAVVTIRQLLESGVHFGHQTRRWNPKMKRFIFTERNGIYIIDLQKSLGYIDSAFEFVKETVAHGGTILFVGTKKQAQEAIAGEAQRVGMPFVNQRWLGGMLTNFQTISKRLARLKELEEVDFDDVAASGLTKKELLGLSREKDKLSRVLGGIRDMSKTPSAVWIVDTNKEHLAVDEARKLGIPIIAVLDTNCDPDQVEYKVPGNDDAIRSVALLTHVVAEAVAQGILARHGGGGSNQSTQAAPEPLADWERELLEQSGASTPPPAPVSTDPAVNTERAVEAADPDRSVPTPIEPTPATGATPSPATPSPATPSPATPSPATPSPAAPSPAAPSPAAATPATPSPAAATPATPSPSAASPAAATSATPSPAVEVPSEPVAAGSVPAAS